MIRYGAALQSINALIGSFSVIILGLVAHSVSLKDHLGNTVPSGLKGISMSFLFWPACGGLVDFLLFLVLLLKTQTRTTNVGIQTRSIASRVGQC